MLSTITPSDALEFLVVSIGVLFLLKRVAEMDRFHKVRVVVLTLILSWFAVMFCFGYGLELGSSGLSNCIVEFEEDGGPGI
jgi:hypothetical protein